MPHYTQAAKQGLYSFLVPKRLEIRTGSPPTMAPDAGTADKIGDFRQITRHISETVQARHANEPTCRYTHVQQAQYFAPPTWRVIKPRKTIGNESVPKIMLNNTICLLFKQQSAFLAVSNRNSIQVRLDKVASVYRPII